MIMMVVMMMIMMVVMMMSVMIMIVTMKMEVIKWGMRVLLIPLMPNGLIMMAVMTWPI